MGGEKRSRGDDGILNGKKQKSEEDNGKSSSVTEEEVEEFFAILRRIHAAANCIERDNGVERRLRDQRWRPSFVLEDFQEINDVKDDIKKEDDSVATAEGHSGLDLNSVPTSK